MTADTNPWIAYRQPRPAARLRLFCFPYAGGAASVYRAWSAELPQEIEVCPVQLPGREGRIREPPARSMDELVEAAAEGLSAELDGGPFALFGHSMGAVAAYELARRRRDSGASEPLHLFASARSAPGMPRLDEPIHDLPSDRFLQRLRELDGTPAEVLEHPELMALLEPLLRADFAVNETWEPRPGEALSCPLTALGGLGDEHVPREHLEAWRGVTRGAFKLHLLGGDHFFLNGPARGDLLRIVARGLLA
jgi:medium-chain acyl-[acyl-carrier-protein] hydrolase